MAPPVVDVEVERHYRVEREVPILEGVRLRIEAGEHWALVGPNGSGKSTLLSIVSGETWASRGRASVLGQAYGRVDKRVLRRKFGVVSAALFAHLPGSDLAVEVVASGLEGRIGRWGAEPPERLAKARQALSSIGALAVADQPYGVLSQGERQRVMIARALVSEPVLLVLDEAAAGLDPVARERFLSDLEVLAERPGGPTQLHVTHHLEEIPRHVTHALLLREGRAIASGPVAAVLTAGWLAEAFGAACRVEMEGERRRLVVSPRSG